MPKKKEAPQDDAFLRSLVKPHVDSFNFCVEEGLSLAIASLNAEEIDAKPDKGLPPVKFWIEDAKVGYHRKMDDTVSSRTFPSECRQAGTSYEGPLSIDFCWQVDGGPKQTVTKCVGQIPLMTMSSRCHLEHLSRDELVRRQEEANELGGYFILNGIERLIRMIIMPRRNVVTAIIRPSMTSRGPDYTPYATLMRCVREDQTGQTMTLHYLQTGACNVRFSLRKQEFFIPAYLLLLVFMEPSDRQIYNSIVGAGDKSSFISDRTEAMIAACKHLKLHTRKQVLSYLGKVFRVIMRCEPSWSDEAVGEKLVRDHVFVHCQRDQDKYNCLVLMMQKLYALVEGRIKPENPDALHCHEILLPGHIYLQIIKEKLQDWLLGVKACILKDVRMDAGKVAMPQLSYWKRIVDMQADVGQKLRYFLVTGNLVSTTGLDLMQTSGFTIVADKLNFFRFLSHFRSVHRGQFFTTMKTTTVRKLLPESWGFMCPVHTPDGSPCGLLNHLAAPCEVLTHPCQTSSSELVAVLRSVGVEPMGITAVAASTDITVLLDGIAVGRVSEATSLHFVTQLRRLKVMKHPGVPRTLEIAAVLDWNDGVFPSINLGTTPARLVRPVHYLLEDGGAPIVEWISPMEQVFMEIACTKDDFRKGKTTHQEIKPTNMLSMIAGFTPFSDFNQSPRNMYQCQMGKQTMGTPYHAHPYRVDNKVFRIQSPQSPLVRNDIYERYKQDEYPLGTNAVVAVISYTGYDMEDAMIINKSAAERGFAHASVYKYKKVNLDDYRVSGEAVHHHFSNEPVKKGGKKKEGQAEAPLPTKLEEGLDSDGLPFVGTRAPLGTPLYAYKDDVTNKSKVVVQKDKEECVVEEVRALGNGNGPLQQLGLKVRYNRNPILGDKFSSRHGQKGVLSQLWPQEDMPFTESGMSPDVLINPHAFPSRMTIGMLIESMAGKAAALNGTRYEGTPFRYNEDNTAVGQFGELMTKAGYNYAGTETLYSGYSGTEMTAEIFFGVVYYQRLRHMVSDKSQVRSTGPTNSITRQPVKGRKMGGGIRFGEMERDSLLAHGTSFLLSDRLMHCSDYHTAHVCRLCGSLTSPTPVNFVDSEFVKESGSVTCRTCQTGKGCTLVAVPYVFVYLVNELAAMNIRMTLDVR